MKPRVSLIKCPDYKPDLVQRSVMRAVDLLGGIETFVRPGARVLIKPNMLVAKAPEKAVTTHPEVVRAAVRLVRGAGGIPVIGDSQGMGSFKRIAETAGLTAVAKEEGASLVELSEAVKVPGKGTFKHFEIAREVMRADVVINLPKAKTHGQMLLTLSVKNLFGCIPGRRKAQWHFKAGVDREAFALMLVELYGMVRPALNIVDAVVGMEGNGPGNGTPREIGLIAASEDAVSLDMLLSEVLGVACDKLPTHRAAKKLGMAPASLSEIELLGDFVGPYQARIKDFKLPSTSSLEWSIPEPVRKLLKEALTAKPRIDAGKCQLCLMCRNACPANAMTEGHESPVINYRQCIRCFCCQEICPAGAIDVVQGWLLRHLH